MSESTASRVFVYTVLLVWLGYGAWLSARTYRGGGAQDRGTRFVFVAGIFLPFLTLPLAAAGFGDLPPGLATPLRWLGGGIMVAGVAVWVTAIRTPGPYFSGTVDLPADHELVVGGIYSRVRHPGYAGMLLAELGFGITTGNWICAAAFLAIPLAAFNVRMRVEENALLARFGEEYAAYMRRTWRLVPHVY